jgi:hypothetical protein
VLTVGFLLLLASFRSLVIAANAVLLNLLWAAAAYGLVFAALEFGWGKNLLSFTGNGSVVSREWVWRPRDGCCGRGAAFGGGCRAAHLAQLVADLHHDSGHE